MQTVPREVHNRSTGVYPVSFSTSSALQGVFAEHPDHPPSLDELPPYKQFDLLAINLRTLVRNILGSVDSQYLSLCPWDVCLTLLIEEMILIKNIIHERTRGHMKVVFYAGMYENPKLLFPMMSTVKQKTAKQLEKYRYELEVINALTVPEDPELATVRKEVKYLINKNEPLQISNNPFAKILILTHLPTDVLFVGNVQPAIIESHTGTIKLPVMLNTKLKGKPERIPFNKITVQVIGDTGDVVSPAHIKDRRELLEFAEQRQWLPTYTYEMVKHDLQAYGSERLKQFIY